MQLEVGAILDGKVTGITKFGVFVDIGEGKTGMVHISEISSTYVTEISEHVKEGQEVKARVLSIGEDGKIRLSMKKLNGDEAESKSKPKPQSTAEQNNGLPAPPAATADGELGIHFLDPFGGKSLTLSYRFHDLKGVCLINAVGNKVVHYIISTSDNLGNITNAVFNKLLCVSKPHISTVRKSRYLQKVREGFGLCLLNHSHNEFRSKLGKPIRADLTFKVTLLNAKRLRGKEELVNRLIVHRNVHNACIARIFLKILIFCRNIVSKLIELKKRIMEIFKGEVRSYYIGVRVIRGVLHGAEIIYLVFLGNNDDSAGVLSR